MVLTVRPVGPAAMVVMAVPVARLCPVWARTAAKGPGVTAVPLVTAATAATGTTATTAAFRAAGPTETAATARVVAMAGLA
ncbi:PE family protein, partial [Mycobacterium ulcerans]